MERFRSYTDCFEKHIFEVCNNNTHNILHKLLPIIYDSYYYSKCHALYLMTNKFSKDYLS